MCNIKLWIAEGNLQDSSYLCFVSGKNLFVSQYKIWFKMFSYSCNFLT